MGFMEFRWNSGGIQVKPVDLLIWRVFLGPHSEAGGPERLWRFHDMRDRVSTFRILSNGHEDLDSKAQVGYRRYRMH